MVKGVHTMFYYSQVEELRNFIKEKLKFTYSDLGDGWLIFDLPDADMGCHPADAEDGSLSGTHNISFYCDDINETVKELKSRGVKFVDEITNAGYGLVTHFVMPGNVEVQLYEPLYEKSTKKKEL